LQAFMRNVLERAVVDIRGSLSQWAADKGVELS